METESDINDSRHPNEIEVSSYRLIYHVPLVDKMFDVSKKLYVSPTTDTKGEFESSNDWVPQPPGGFFEGFSQSERFAETVYFHNFVRQFLYKTNGDSNFVNTFHRNKKSLEFPSVRVDFGDREISLELTRQRVQFFRSGLAIMMLELKCVGVASIDKETGRSGGQRSLNLGDVMMTNDLLRRLFAPYYDKKSLEPGGIPKKVVVEEQSYAEGGDLNAQVSRLENNTENDPLILPHWDHWLAPFKLNEENPRWSLPADERVPFMSYIELANVVNPRATFDQVRESDWYRIAEADLTSGDQKTDNFGYNPDFLKTYVEGSFYDRFMSHKHTPAYLATRHIFGGSVYAFVTVEGSPIDFEAHFRTMYEKMALMVRFNHTGLLAFSARVSKAVERHQRGEYSQHRLRNLILQIREDFMTFTHQFWFTGVSNQIQSQEMYDKWRKNLSLNVLFDEVRQEITDASDFVNARVANQHARIGWVSAIAAAFIFLVFEMFGPLFEGWLWRLVFLGAVGVISFMSYLAWPRFRSGRS